MKFHGTCTLSLTADAVKEAIENALNASGLVGEARIRVTSVEHSYSYGPWRVDITTDPEDPAVGAVELRAT